jgi:hypothetical protein
MENGPCVLAGALFAYGVLSWCRLLRGTRHPGGGDAPRTVAERAWSAVCGSGELGSCGLLLAIATCGFYVIIRAVQGRSGAADAFGLEGVAALLLGLATGVASMHVLARLHRVSGRCSDLEAALRAALGKIEILKREQRLTGAMLARALREKEELEARSAELLLHGRECQYALHEASKFVDGQ